jgi:SOS response regulatory protein OraA/RecX
MAERLMESNVSKREAMHKMLLKGLSYDLIREMLDSGEIDEEEKIKNLSEGKYARKLTEEKGTEKVYAALVRKGFSYSAVRTAMKNFTQELEFCED